MLFSYYIYNAQNLFFFNKLNDWIWNIKVGQQTKSLNGYFAEIQAILYIIFFHNSYVAFNYIKNIILEKHKLLLTY